MSATQIASYNGYPVVGILPELIRDKPYDVLHHISDTHGDFVQVKIGPRTAYLVSNPDYFQYILRDNYKNYEKPELFYSGVRAAIGNGLVASKGDFWLRQRRMMQPFFHNTYLAQLTAIMVNAIDEMFTDWDHIAASGETTELYELVTKLTINVITNTMFGSYISTEDRNKVINTMPEMTDYAAILGYLPFIPGWVPLPGKGRFTAQRQAFHDIVLKLIKERRANPTDEYTMLNMLIQAVDEETDQRMSDEQMLAETMTIFAAGYDTLSMTLMWLFILLDDAPHVLEGLIEEVERVLGQRMPTFESARQLTYCKQAMQETLRMRTVAPVLPRKALNTDRIGDHTIPAGSFMLMWFSGLHYNTAIWDNPDMFDPTRFAPEQAAQRSAFSYLPFSGGPRICIGNEFAYLEGVAAIAMILQRYRLHIRPNQDLYPKIGSVLRPANPAEVTIERIS